jgi:flagellum-specific ATP synthase
MTMTDLADNRHLAAWHGFLDGCRQTASQASSLLPSGHLTRINGLVMEASGLKLPLGSSCRIVRWVARRSRQKWSASTASDFS